MSAYPRVKPVVTRPLNAANHPALTRQQSKKLNSSIVGPTIKSSSRLSAYLPEIGKKGGEVRNDGETEPLLESRIRAIADSKSNQADADKFWSDSKRA